MSTSNIITRDVGGTVEILGSGSALTSMDGDDDASIGTRAADGESSSERRKTNQGELFGGDERKIVNRRSLSQCI